MLKLQPQGMPASSILDTKCSRAICDMRSLGISCRQSCLHGAQFELCSAFLPCIIMTREILLTSLSFSVSPSLGSFAQP